MSGATGAVRLRAHNLLCIQGFVGLGYSPAFVARMTAVVESLQDDAHVEVLDRPDVRCDACPNRSAGGCALHGAGSEQGIVAQDRAVLGRLGLEPGAVESWGAILERIRRAVAPDDLDALCGACPWLPLGVCKQGLAYLRGEGPPPASQSL